MSAEIEALRQDLRRLQVQVGAMASLVCDLLEITHRTDPEALRRQMRAISNSLLDPEQVGGLTDEAREAHRIRLALIEQAVTQLEGLA